MGLNTRAMGGIDLDAAYDVAGVTRDRLTSVCANTVGYRRTNVGIHPRMVKTILLITATISKRLNSKISL